MQNESGTIKKSKEKIEREGRKEREEGKKDGRKGRGRKRKEGEGKKGRKERRKGNRKEGRVKCKKDIGASQEKLTMAKLEQFEQQISYKRI